MSSYVNEPLCPRATSSAAFESHLGAPLNTGGALGVVRGVRGEDLQGLVDLVVEGLRGLQHVQQLGVVHLEEHARDLTRQIGLALLDEREDALADHLLLLGRVGVGEHLRRERRVEVLRGDGARRGATHALLGHPARGARHGRRPPGALLAERRAARVPQLLRYDGCGGW